MILEACLTRILECRQTLSINRITGTFKGKSMTKTLTKLAFLGFVVFTGAFAPFAKADEWNKKTVITVHEPLQIRGKVLEPGQYVMKLLDSQSDRRTVQIYDVNETKLEMTIIANSAYRLKPTGDTRFTFSETQDGQALATWFYPGDNSGLEFSVTR
jgi:hypothetical protein